MVNWSVSEWEFMKAVEKCGFPTPTTAQYQGFVNGLGKDQISSKREAAMALAQFIHESGGLLHKSEWACRRDGPNPGCMGQYETPGLDAPGKRYYGRGYIQLTWAANYKRASLDLYGDQRLLKDPDQVAQNENVAWAVSFWYWKVYVHSVAVTGKFGATTKQINGASEECQGTGKNADKSKKRFWYYQQIFKIFDISGKPDESGCCY